MNWINKSAVIGSLATLALAVPRPAVACGGTFCDSGPTAMPVDQSGENILFVMEPGYVEAHVQIQYQGSAERFAWVVPIQQIPEVSVGSQFLFDNLLASTSPAYGFNQTFDQCGGNSGSGGSGASSGQGGSGGAFGSAGSGGGGGGPTVVFEETVGTFEVVALQGGTAQEVSTWLDQNGYQSVDTAPALLNKYVQKGFVFVALKLTAGAEVDEIHPLVFRYPGDEPCIPLELTAVAAVEDMGVRAFFLGDDRVVPTNYKHIELNPTRLDWSSLGSNYSQWVSRGVDSALAGGHGFVTEYASNSNVVPTNNLRGAGWNPAALATLPPEQVIDELRNQGMVNWCDESDCGFNHPLMLPLMREYLPAPTGYTEPQFWSCLSCYVDLIDGAAWDAAGFSAAYESRIVTPGEHAETILGRYPYLTRMFTTISPAEMTEDPMFHARTDLEPVDLRSAIATQRTTCDGQQAMILPDGREVGLSSSWPAFSSVMPWAERIEEFTPDQPPVVLQDNKQVIDEELARWNASVGWPPIGDVIGAAGAGGSPSGGNGGTASGGSGAGGSAGTANGAAPAAGGGGGCSTSTGSGPFGAALVLGLFGAAGALRRRRRGAFTGRL